MAEGLQVAARIVRMNVDNVRQFHGRRRLSFSAASKGGRGYGALQEIPPGTGTIGHATILNELKPEIGSI